MLAKLLSGKYDLCCHPYLYSVFKIDGRVTQRDLLKSIGRTHPLR